MQANIYDSIRPAQKIKSLKEFQPYIGISFRDFCFYCGLWLDRNAVFMYADYYVAKDDTLC